MLAGGLPTASDEERQWGWRPQGWGPSLRPLCLVPPGGPGAPHHLSLLQVPFQKQWTGHHGRSLSLSEATRGSWERKPGAGTAAHRQALKSVASSLIPTTQAAFPKPNSHARIPSLRSLLCFPQAQPRHRGWDEGSRLTGATEKAHLPSLGIIWVLFMDCGCGRDWASWACLPAFFRLQSCSV